MHVFTTQLNFSELNSTRIKLVRNVPDFNIQNRHTVKQDVLNNCLSK